jgi:hypothetical protein
LRAVEQTGDLRAQTAVVDLFRKEREWRLLFRKCCEDSPERLRSSVKQVRDELDRRGERFELGEVEDVLLILAREKLPDSPAARWDADHASRLCKDALARLGEHYARLSEDERDRLDLSDQDPHEDAMLAAGEENDTVAFRAALKGWERAGLEALDRTRGRDGVCSLSEHDEGRLGQAVDRLMDAQEEVSDRQTGAGATRRIP